MIGSKSIGSSVYIDVRWVAGLDQEVMGQRKDQRICERLCKSRAIMNKSQKPFSGAGNGRLLVDR